jgi:hypothetical protein
MQGNFRERDLAIYLNNHRPFKNEKIVNFEYLLKWTDHEN